MAHGEASIGSPRATARGNGVETERQPSRRRTARTGGPIARSQDAGKRHPRLTEEIIAGYRRNDPEAIRTIENVIAGMGRAACKRSGISDSERRREICEAVAFEAAVHLEDPDATPESLTRVIDNAAAKYAKREVRSRVRSGPPLEDDPNESGDGSHRPGVLAFVEDGAPLPDSLLEFREDCEKVVHNFFVALSKLRSTNPQYYRVCLHLLGLELGEDASAADDVSSDSRNRALAALRACFKEACAERFRALPPGHLDLQLHGALYMFLDSTDEKGSRQFPTFVALLLDYLQYLAGRESGEV